MLLYEGEAQGLHNINTMFSTNTTYSKEGVKHYCMPVVKFLARLLVKIASSLTVVTAVSASAVCMWQWVYILFCKIHHSKLILTCVK